MGHGTGYRYDHDEQDGLSAGQTYFPDGMGERRYYEPVNRGLGIQIAEKLARIADRKYNRPFWRGRPLLLLNSNPVSRNERGGLPPFTPKFHGATMTTPRGGRFLPRNVDRLVRRARATLCLSVRRASRPCVRAGRYRQPGSFRPDISCCGGARAKGLKAGVAGAARRSRWASVCLITAGSSMLAHTLSAAPQSAQVKFSILNIRSTVASRSSRRGARARVGRPSQLCAGLVWPASLVHAADGSAQRPRYAVHRIMA